MAAREIYEAQGFPMTKSASLDSAEIHPLTYSYNNYAGEISRLWSGYEKPAIIGETGWDHTYFEPGMPGYLAMYHNALWVTLASGTAMSPFWWAFSGRLNDNVVSNQMLNFKKFTDAIPFATLSGLTPFRTKLSGGGDAFGMKSNEMLFGWITDPAADVAGASVELSALSNGKYKLRLYHTWRGEFIKEEEIEVREGITTFRVPYLHTTGSHANYVGPDVAYILERMPAAVKDAKAVKKKSTGTR
jgi:hypothetical protein